MERSEPAEVSPEDKRQLLAYARSVIKARVNGEPVSELPRGCAVLEEKRGAFVTLHRRGELRGCIGYLQGYAPLNRTIREMAGAAAFEDPRFMPVAAGEVDELEIEISVLTPLVKTEDPGSIEIGVHGIYIKKEGNSGLLLPQVATENNWDRETFLKQTCRKAGLPADAWEDGAEIFTFKADIFSEKEL